jgi:hypothetical protein
MLGTATVIPIPAFALSPTVCATPLTYEIFDTISGQAVSEVFQSGTTLVISTSDPYKKGQRSYTIQATAATTAFVNGVTGFSQLSVFY